MTTERVKTLTSRQESQRDILWASTLPHRITNEQEQSDKPLPRQTEVVDGYFDGFLLFGNENENENENELRAGGSK